MKFIGKFTELKPMGFTFHKLYARNYKVYMLEDFSIWVSRREFLYRHINGPLLDQIVNSIIADTYPLYDRQVMLGGRPLMDIGDPKMCIIDKNDYTFMSHEKFLGKWKQEFPDMDEYMQFAHGSGRFEELILHKRHLKLIKTLHEREMICQNL